jgi:hypothetical protein
VQRDRQGAQGPPGTPTLAPSYTGGLTRANPAPWKR